MEELPVVEEKPAEPEVKSEESEIRSDEANSEEEVPAAVQQKQDMSAYDLHQLDD